jgi:hypothetical protein
LAEIRSQSPFFRLRHFDRLRVNAKATVGRSNWLRGNSARESMVRDDYGCNFAVVQIATAETPPNMDGPFAVQLGLPNQRVR